FVHSLDTGKTHQVTDGMSDARHVVFDKGGKYLYFAASTDIGPSVGAGMSILNRGVTRSAYVVVLSKDDSSPLSPETGDEAPKSKNADKDKKDTDKAPPKVRIDLDDLDQRTLALPVPARNYFGLRAGKAGTIFLLEAPAVFNPDDESLNPEDPPLTVHRFDLPKRKSEKLTEGATHFAVSDDGEKMLFRQGEGGFLVATAQ